MNDHLIAQYRILHQTNKSYGNAAYYHLHITALINEYKLENFLDFGCGKGNLAEKLNSVFRTQGKNCFRYDPAIPEFSAAPKPVDLAIANDVFEHFDGKQVEDDLQYVQWLAGKAVFANISCRPAVHHLPDGTNCHTCLMPAESWLDLMDRVFHDKRRIETQYNTKNESLRVFYVSNQLLMAKEKA